MPYPTRWTGPFADWGPVTSRDRTRRLPADDLVDDPHQVLHRAVEVEAPAAHVFRWVCQLRAAPYSYDLVDNLGRRSPRELPPGLGELAPGQRINTIFEVVDHEPDRSVTMRFASGWFGTVVCTYLVEARSATSSRILVRFAVRYADTLAATAASWLLPAGDLVMMRRQLVNLARHAERTTA